MSKKTRVPIKIHKKITTGSDSSTVKTKYETNLVPSDILEFITVIGGKVDRKEYFKVLEINEFTLKVAGGKKCGDVEGILDYKQLLGNVSPSPTNQIRTHFAIIREKQ